ncbi:hypothetical protein HII13_002771 [Brettanomyces bruxellensis]|nr:hypothetical protein HII13_002771 [Brettanomyces bruxellensis]
MGKRQLGIGRNLRKRQKTEVASKAEKKQANGLKESAEKDTEEYITVPLDEEADAEDPTSQLRALWKTWLDSDRESELLLNGIVNECDRLVRLADKVSKTRKDQTIELESDVYAIFGMALAELAKFHTEDTTAGSTVKDYFDNAVERIELGEARKPENGIIRLAHASVDLSRIPLEYISKMDLDSKAKAFPNIEKLLDKALEEYSSGYRQKWVLEIFDSLDDLIDIVKSFGEDHNEQIDSDDEESLEKAEAGANGKTIVKKEHPLYQLIEQVEEDGNKYSSFFEKQLLNFLKEVSVAKKATAGGEELKQGAESKLGLWLLAKAAELQFEGEDKAHDEGIKILRKAIEHLEKSWNEEIPSTWVDLAEAKNQLGKANNATHGKYQEILDSLVDGKSD